MSPSVREYDPERMSRCPSPSRSTNCGVEDVHHHTPGTSATLPSAFSHSPAANFVPPRFLNTCILPLRELPDDQVLLAVSVHVRPGGAGVAGGLDADRRVAALQPDRGLEVRGPARGGADSKPEGRQQSSTSWNIPPPRNRGSECRSDGGRGRHMLTRGEGVFNLRASSLKRAARSAATLNEKAPEKSRGLSCYTWYRTTHLMNSISR